MTSIRKNFLYGIMLFISILITFFTMIITANQQQEFVNSNTKIIEFDKIAVSKHIQKSNDIPIIFQLENIVDFDKLISKMPSESFKLKKRLNTWFATNVSFSGLQIISNEQKIKRIYYDYKPVNLLNESVLVIGANRVWSSSIANRNLDGYNQTICVVDTGVNYTHTALDGCPLTNDINSANCSKVIGGYDAVDTDNNPMDIDGHGTIVAGVVAAQGSINGVAKNVSIVALRGTDGISLLDVKEAIEWCIDHREQYNIKIITLSYATTVDNEIVNYNSYCNDADLGVKAANNATQFGLFVDASSGNQRNSTGITSPACGSNITSVGATYDFPAQITFLGGELNCTDNNHGEDYIACFSNKNSILDLVAPGCGITSTDKTGSYTEGFCGTSVAAPHVAGVAALMLQAANLSNITLTPAQIELIMKRTGVPIYDSVTGITFPRIDAYRAVMAVLYDVFVSDLREAYSDDQGRKVFEFNIFNDFGADVTVNWTLDTGDGNVLRSDNFTMYLSDNNNTLVSVDYVYSNVGTYNVTANVFSSNGTTRSQTIEVSVTKPNVRILNQSIMYSSGTRRVFSFLVQNNASVAYNNITWQMNFTGANNPPLNSTSDVALTAGEVMSVIVDYIYAQSGSHTVTITADYLNTHNEYDESNTVTISD